MMKKKLNVALIGYKFMGKAHSHAWKTAPDFFDMDACPVLKGIAQRLDRGQYAGAHAENMVYA